MLKPEKFRKFRKVREKRREEKRREEEKEKKEKFRKVLDINLVFCFSSLQNWFANQER